MKILITFHELVMVGYQVHSEIKEIIGRTSFSSNKLKSILPNHHCSITLLHKFRNLSYHEKPLKILAIECSPAFDEFDIIKTLFFLIRK